MSDFESFAGMEEGEGGGAGTEAVEHLREQMKKASAAIKAIQREEKKRKKKDDNLAALLVKLIQGGGTSQGTLALIVQLLAENIPAPFILAILVLGHEDIREEAGNDLKLKNYDDPEKKMIAGEKIDLTKEEKRIFKKKAKELKDLDDDEILSPSMRKDIAAWGEAMLAAGFSAPHKTLATVLNENKNIKAPVVQLATFNLRDYFEHHGVEHEYDELWEFAAAVLRTVMTKLNRAAKTIPVEKLPELKLGEK